MGLLGDIFRDVTKEAKSALKSELRSEVRQETRNAVRETINSAKQGIGQVAQNAKSKKEQSPNVVNASTTAVAVPESSANVGAAMADMTETTQPVAQIMSQVLDDQDSLQGKVMNAFVGAQMTEAEKAEMQEGLAMLSDPEKMAEAKQALTDNSAEIEAKLRESGIDPEALRNFLNQGAEAAKKLQDE